MKNSELINILRTYLDEDGDMDIALPESSEDEEGKIVSWLADVSVVEVQVKDDGTRVLSIF